MYCRVGTNTPYDGLGRCGGKQDEDQHGTLKVGNEGNENQHDLHEGCTCKEHGAWRMAHVLLLPGRGCRLPQEYDHVEWSAGDVLACGWVVTQPCDFGRRNGRCGPLPNVLGRQPDRLDWSRNLPMWLVDVGSRRTTVDES